MKTKTTKQYAKRCRDAELRAWERAGERAQQNALEEARRLTNRAIKLNRLDPPVDASVRDAATAALRQYEIAGAQPPPLVYALAYGGVR